MHTHVHHAHMNTHAYTDIHPHTHLLTTDPWRKQTSSKHTRTRNHRLWGQKPHPHPYPHDAHRRCAEVRCAEAVSPDHTRAAWLARTPQGTWAHSQITIAATTAHTSQARAHAHALTLKPYTRINTHTHLPCSFRPLAARHAGLDRILRLQQLPQRVLDHARHVLQHCCWHRLGLYVHVVEGTGAGELW